MKYLSGVELYYSPDIAENNSDNIIYGDDFRHIVRVMRHTRGDEIYITDGRGKIFLSVIKKIDKNHLTVSVEEVLIYENKYQDFYFCIPKLNSSDRFEFAIEKCTELGITNFIIYNPERGIHKADKKERWNKIIISAVKQSLRSFLPEIKTVKSVNEIIKFNGQKILLEQNSVKKITELKINPGEKYFFVFGPEGGFHEKESDLFSEKYRLADNRLRTETAVIKCASLITFS